VLIELQYRIPFASPERRQLIFNPLLAIILISAALVGSSGGSSSSSSPGGSSSLSSLLDSSGRGWIFQRAAGINNGGHISGNGINPRGQARAGGGITASLFCEYKLSMKSESKVAAPEVIS
jgi:hypothetical protein